MFKAIKRNFKASRSKKDKLESSLSETEVASVYQKKRLDIASSVSDFKMNKSRVRILNECKTVKEGRSSVLYWMHRDQRVQDNWAMIFAQRLANKYELDLKVGFCLPKTYMNHTLRHYDFLIKGLVEVNQQLTELHIPFEVLLGDPETNILKKVKEENVSVVIVDFLPLNPFKSWVETLIKTLPKEVSICQVDAHNIVPCWEACEKQAFSARVFRPKIMKQLPSYLTEFPPVIKHQFNKNFSANKFDSTRLFDFVKNNPKVPPITWAQPGPTQGLKALESFVNSRLKDFAEYRNDAVKQHTSNLSPYLHFGQLSAQRALLRVSEFRDKFKHDVDIYIEESVVRRELSDNFCFYAKNPTDPSSAPEWGRKTVHQHLSDPRPYIYNLEELESASTHSDVWNAAQKQLKTTGKMSGYMRMLWAKKMLEWTEKPEQAFEIALYLNDKYSIDGNDPSGLVGCHWSIYGLHDRPFIERKIFGKVRCMTENGCNKHFKTQEYVAKYL